MAGMKNPTPLFFPTEPLVPAPVLELTEEIARCMAALVLQVLEADDAEEVDRDEQ